MSDEFRKEIILTWFNRAKKNYIGPVSGLNEGLFWADSLIYAWISFDSFTCLKFPNFRVDIRNEDFSIHFQRLYEEHSFSDRFKKSRVGIVQYSIPDMRPGSTNEPFKIQDPRKLSEIIKAIYNVRCNLFHGGKEVNNKEARDLIKYASELLYEILEVVLQREKIIEQ